MMIIVFSSTLFQLCLLFLHGIQFGVEATKSNAYQNEIIIDGQQCILVVEQDQEPIDAVYGFLKEHNLSLLPKGLFAPLCASTIIRYDGNMYYKETEK